jgi:PST family polysaccharide transporter
MGDDLARLRHGYLKTVQYIALVTFPMMTAVIVVAPSLVRVAFGPGWEPVALLIAILSLAGMAHSVGTTVGGLFLSRGRADSMLRWELVASACYTAAIVAGLPWGLPGVAIAYTATALVLWPISHAVANRLIDLPLGELYRRLVPPAVLAAVVGCGIAVLRVAWQPADRGTEAAFLGAAAALAALILSGGAALGRPAAIGEVLGLVRDAFAGRPARTS